MVQLSWFGHSTVFFRNRNCSCICDPISDQSILSSVPTLESEPRAAFVSHKHWDHFHPETISDIAAEGMMLYAPEDVVDVAQADERLSRLRLRAVQPGDMVDLGGIACEVLEASEGVAYAFTFKRDNIVIIFMGDSVLLEPMKSIRSDIVFFPLWPFKDPEHADELREFLRVNVAIPMHFHHDPSARQNFFIGEEEFKELMDSIGTARVLTRREKYEAYIRSTRLCLDPLPSTNSAP
ncbi:MAG: MBL fold metallo-hydrolase [Candidatus Coatesbacteria bacterium]|nr:MBL fold metallo-hydrolase [Candidatus Coatesbacteria bacterium]